VALGALALAPGARAGGDEIAAEVLFEQGRALLKEGRLAEACAKLEASDRASPAVGTKLAWAACLEKSGKTASAWVRFREAAAAAHLAHQADRERAASLHAARLEGQLARLVVSAESAAATSGLVVERDGAPIEPALWGTGVPVDPGTHVVAAHAPGHRPWQTEVAVPPPAPTQGERSSRAVVVEVPALAPEPRAMAPTAPAAAQPLPAKPAVAPPVQAPAIAAASGADADRAAPPPPAAADARDARRAIAYAAGALSVASFTVATVLAVRARSAFAEAEGACAARGCPDAARDQAAAAARTADYATAAAVVGGLAAASGAVLWLTATPPSDGVAAKALVEIGGRF
jgi:hypothetical protein